MNCVKQQFTQDETESAGSELNCLLQKRVIEVITYKRGEFISPIFGKNNAWWYMQTDFVSLKKLNQIAEFK